MTERAVDERGALLDELRAHAAFPDRFGLHLGSGWIPLIRHCHHRLVTEFPDYQVQVISQKWGGLRFNAHPYGRLDPQDEQAADPRFDEIIESTARQCEETCELCGAPGTERDDRVYVMTLCDRCDSATPDWPAPRRVSAIICDSAGHEFRVGLELHSSLDLYDPAALRQRWWGYVQGGPDPMDGATPGPAKVFVGDHMSTGELRPGPVGWTVSGDGPPPSSGETPTPSWS